MRRQAAATTKTKRGKVAWLPPPTQIHVMFQGSRVVMVSTFIVFKIRVAPRYPQSVLIHEERVIAKKVVERVEDLLDPFPFSSRKERQVCII